MILALAVMTILALIACASLYAKEVQAKDLSDQLFEEKEVSSQLRNEKHHEWERAELAQEQITCLKQEIADIKSNFKNLIADELTQDHGTFIKHRSARKPTAETYRILFDLNTNGQEVIDDLVSRFKRSPFVPDSQGGERETSRRLGRAEVIDFILNKVNVANSPNYNEALEIAYMEQKDD